jgi:UDP-N-acetyl-D-glucosamine dehydrogenase
VLDEVLARGARIAYHDPLVPELALHGRTLRTVPIDPIELSAVDAVVLLTAHTSINYDQIIQHASLVLDTHSGLHVREAANVINLWLPPV